MILDFIYPRRCPVCNEVLPFGPFCICDGCRKKLSFVSQPVCMGCGKEMKKSGFDSFGAEEYCPDCMRHEKCFSGGIALLNYDETAKKLMAGLKYKNRREYAGFLAEEMVRRHGKKILRLRADGLVPVPIHRKRRRERGYNQAELLAKELSWRLSLPVKQLLSRMEDTQAQKKLGYEARQKNEAGAFTARDCNGMGNLLLVDDIYTTGATAQACTKALLEAGAGKVWLLNMAIGIGRS
ncbi:MAG: ComF family protein [Lachnospiraceae bacterium]|nr:ComF family protein [Lachnospiraceae bacterium]